MRLFQSKSTFQTDCLFLLLIKNVSILFLFHIFFFFFFFYYLGFLMHLQCRKCPESLKCSVLLRLIFNVNFAGSEMPVFIALWMLSGNEYVKSLRNKLHTCDLFYYRELKFFCYVSVQLAASLAVPVELPFHMLLIELQKGKRITQESCLVLLRGGDFFFLWHLIQETQFFSCKKLIYFNLLTDSSLASFFSSGDTANLCLFACILVLHWASATELVVDLSQCRGS